MPHTKDGVEVKKGDTLFVPVVVMSVQSGTEYCNVTVETAEPMFPSNTPTCLTFNTKQLVARQVTHGPGPGPNPEQEPSKETASEPDSGAPAG